MATATRRKNRLNGQIATEELAKVEKLKAVDKEKANVELKNLEIKEFIVRIVGTSPLIVQAFSEKARKSIEDKQQKKAKTAKPVRKPDEEYRACFYMKKGEPLSKGCVYGLPAAGFKKICMKAAVFVDMFSTECRAFKVSDEDRTDMIALKVSAPHMREDTVRLNGKSLDLRYRPQFDSWECNLLISYNASSISPEQIINLLQNGGFAIGWGELRAEKGFGNGCFEVAKS